MLCNASFVYVKGTEKKLFLQKLLKKEFDIIDVTDTNCPPLKKLVDVDELNKKRPHYQDENSEYQCTLENIHVLKLWICTKYFEDEYKNMYK